MMTGYKKNPICVKVHVSAFNVYEKLFGRKNKGSFSRYTVYDGHHRKYVTSVIQCKLWHKIKPYTSQYVAMVYWELMNLPFLRIWYVVS